MTSSAKTLRALADMGEDRVRDGLLYIKYLEQRLKAATSILKNISPTHEATCECEVCAFIGHAAAKAKEGKRK